MTEIYKTSIIFFALLATLSTQPVFAAPEKGFDKSSILCSQFNEIDAKISSKITERETIFETKKENRMSDLESKWTEIDAKREEKRNEADTLLATQIASLNTKATTEAQRTAITSYNTSVTTALALRREKIDAIMSDYRTNISLAIQDRSEISTEAIVFFKQSVESAIEKVVLQCESDISKKDIRANLKSAMEQARATLRDTIDSLDPKTTIENSTMNSKAGMDVAQKEFEQSLENARIELKKAFE